MICLISIFSCKKNTNTSGSNNNTTAPPTGSNLTEVTSGVAVGAICFDQANTLWTPNLCTGVNSYNGTALVTYASPIISGNSLSSNIAYFNNSVYAYVNNSASACLGTVGLNIYASGAWSLNTNPNATSNFFYNKFKNELWFFKDTTNGITIHALKTNNSWYTINCSINFGTNPVYVSRMATDAIGNVWMSGNCGGTFLGLLRYSGGMWNQYTTANSNLPSDTICGLDVNSTGIVWLSCPSSLVKFDGTNWTVATASQIGGSPFYVGNGGLVVNQNTNNVYVASLSAGGIIKYDGTKYTKITNSNLGAIYAMRFDGNNNLWVSANGSLYKCTNP